MSLEEVHRETVTFVEFLFPGTLFPEEKIERHEDREMPVVVPEGAFCYSFFDVEKTVVGEEEFWGKRKNHSGRFYPDAAVFTLEEVKALPDIGFLASNMEANGWEKVVRTRRGNFQPLQPGDTIL